VRRTALDQEDPVTQPQASPPGKRPQKDGLPWFRTLLLGVLMIAVIAGGFGIWYIFFRPGGPAAVGTGAPVIPGAAATATATAASGSAAPVTSAAPISIDGAWTVDPSVGSFDYAAGDFSGTWAGYRVQEQLVGLSGSTAVGRTPDVTGTLTLAGTQLTAADLSVDLTTLMSDQSFRDGQLGRQGVQTDQFPTATFVLTAPIDLGSVPADGQQVSATATGDLTIHGVTKSVQIPLTARLTQDVIGVSGSITFTWEEFGMTQPSSQKVVSLADDVTMEFQVFFRKDG
jgi:polyisoprenoid-binding protein YceI